MRIKVDTNKLSNQKIAFANIQRKLDMVTSQLNTLKRKSDWDDIYNGEAWGVKQEIDRCADDVTTCFRVCSKYCKFIDDSCVKYNAIDYELLNKDRIKDVEFPIDDVLGLVGEFAGPEVGLACELITTVKNSLVPAVDIGIHEENTAKDLTEITACTANVVVSKLSDNIISKALASEVGVAISVAKDCVSSIIDNNEEFINSSDYYRKDAETVAGIGFSIAKGALVLAGGALLVGTIGIGLAPALAISGAAVGIAHWIGDSIVVSKGDGRNIQERFEDICGDAANVSRERLSCQYASLVDDPNDYNQIAQRMRFERRGY